MKQSLKNRVRKSTLKLHERFGIHPVPSTAEMNCNSFMLKNNEKSSIGL